MVTYAEAEKKIKTHQDLFINEVPAKVMVQLMKNHIVKTVSYKENIWEINFIETDSTEYEFGDIIFDFTAEDKNFSDINTMITSAINVADAHTWCVIDGIEYVLYPELLETKE